MTIDLVRRIIINVPDAGMAELADALDSGSSESNFMQVQVLFPALDKGETTLVSSFLFFEKF